jgi:hypothetical protein
LCVCARLGCFVSENDQYEGLSFLDRLKYTNEKKEKLYRRLEASAVPTFQPDVKLRPDVGKEQPDFLTRYNADVQCRFGRKANPRVILDPNCTFEPKLDPKILTMDLGGTLTERMDKFIAERNQKLDRLREEQFNRFKKRK